MPIFIKCVLVFLIGLFPSIAWASPNDQKPFAGELNDPSSAILTKEDAIQMFQMNLEMWNSNAIMVAKVAEVSLKDSGIKIEAQKESGKEVYSLVYKHAFPVDSYTQVLPIYFDPTGKPQALALSVNYASSSPGSIYCKKENMAEALKNKVEKEMAPEFSVTTTFNHTVEGCLINFYIKGKDDPPPFTTPTGNIPVGDYGKEVRVYNELKGGQATNYLSEEIALEFLNKLLRESGPLKEIIDTHKAKVCEGSSYCGALNVPSHLSLIASYRGGWFGGAIMYRAILTWSDAGTGHYTYPLMELDIEQSAESEKLGIGKYKTTLTTEITGFKKYEQEAFEDQNVIKLPAPTWKVEDAAVASEDSAGPSVETSARFLDRDDYLAMVEDKIDRQWVAPPLIANAPVVVVKFRISRSGEISNIHIDESSGNGNYDSAAKRAVSAVNPLPPFPPDISDSFFEVRFRFIKKD